MPDRRVILIVIDACGVGELPDAAAYDDTGAATLPNIATEVEGLNLPTCQKLGLGNIVPIVGVPASDSPLAAFGKMAEKSPGKDSTTGHWEIGGIVLSEPFPVFPDGFPRALVEEFESRADVRTIGNYPASGTEIIKQLGQRHLETGELILYTSADSVFQLAAHEDIFPLERLYEICQVARQMLTGDFAVARVIARPFTGKPDNYVRTAGRKDFSLQPPGDTILDVMIDAGLGTLAVGKIYDLYAQRGFSGKIKTKNNAEVMSAMIEAARNDTRHQLVFGNCVDFDMLWGHRNDTAGFARGLEEFDQYLDQLLSALRDDDMLIITADHGCDPTIKRSTDHTREYVPVIVYGRHLNNNINIGTRETFADIAETICRYFDLNHSFGATSFLNQVISK